MADISLEREEREKENVIAVCLYEPLHSDPAVQ